METKTVLQFDLLIDGKMTPSSEGGYFECVNPSTGNVFARAADASVQDMRRAIVAARRAFDEGVWSCLSFAERGAFLRRIADAIRLEAKDFAELETLDCGKTLKQTTFIDIPTAAETFEYFSKIDERDLGPRDNPVSAPVKSVTEREPIGVIGSIIPWNYPLIMASWKIAPALIAGNTVVFKPSPLASASVMKLAGIAVQAGLPQGVLNIVSSSRTDTASELVRNPDVDMISFTGGNKTGREIIRLAAETQKKVSLELGGKSPNLVFSDCHFDAAVGGTMSSIFMNQGQMCTACSRLFIQESMYDRFLSELVKRTKSLKIGNAMHYETAFGPLISREHRDDVLKMIQAAEKQGARVVCGGNIPAGDDLADGFYLEPTILSDVRPDMEIFQKEIFGPVLCIMPFKNEGDVLRLANDSQYGLAACIWTEDDEKAKRLSSGLRCGIVWINTYGGFYNEASFGGCKRSGSGRELGIEGLYEYTQTKHICADKTPGGLPLVSSWF